MEEVSSMNTSLSSDEASLNIPRTKEQGLDVILKAPVHEIGTDTFALKGLCYVAASWCAA
jgi:hypothetical protein